jgi:ribonuclease HI
MVYSKTVLKCKHNLRRAQQKYKIGLKWVRGHDNNTGTELADYLAKEGCKRRPEPTLAPKSAARWAVSEFYQNK